MMLVGSVRRIVAALTALMTMTVITHAQDFNDYPTSARVEYVFGCLKANGETRQAIEQCSCSIDVVASLVPYERYVTAETVLSMSQVRGDMGGPVPHIRSGGKRAQRAQAGPGRSGSALFLRRCTRLGSNPGIVDLPFALEDVSLGILCLGAEIFRAIRDVGEPDIGIFRN